MLCEIKAMSKKLAELGRLQIVVDHWHSKGIGSAEDPDTYFGILLLCRKENGELASYVLRFRSAESTSHTTTRQEIEETLEVLS